MVDTDGEANAPVHAHGAVTHLDVEDPFDRFEHVAEEASERLLARVARLLGVSVSPAGLRFLTPLLFLAAGAVVLTAFYWDDLFAVWSFVGVYFAPLGIETGVPYGLLAQDLAPWLIVTIVIYVDVFGGLFLVWNLDILWRTPKLGTWLQKVEKKAAAKWEKRRRLRDMGVVGLGLFVLLPISGSGAVPGAIIGRLAGFPWALVWIAIVAGSSARVVLYTLLWVYVPGIFPEP